MFVRTVLSVDCEIGTWRQPAAPLWGLARSESRSRRGLVPDCLCFFYRMGVGNRAAKGVVVKTGPLRTIRLEDHFLTTPSS